MANVDGVYEPELCCDFKEDVTHALDDERLFALAHVEYFQKLAICAPNIVEVSKDLIDESVDFGEGYHRRDCVA